jgi:tetratricopeptide (TPR) repeat protein
MVRRGLVAFLFGCCLATQLTAGTALAQPTSYADRVHELVARGKDFEQRGDPTTAIAYYRDAVAAGPRDPRGYVALGFCYLALSEWARAGEVFEAGTSASARFDEQLSWGLFEAQRSLGNRREALRALRNILAAEPDSVPALTALAELASELGLWMSALAATRALATQASTDDERSADSWKLRERALELILAASERVRAQPCPGASAVLSALGRCR